MQHGHNDLGGGNALLAVNVHGYAATVIGHGDRLVGVNDDHHLVAVAFQGLINGVVHHLKHHVVQAAAIIGVPDVHSRPFADRIEPSQDFDFAGIVYVVFGHGGSINVDRLF